MLKFILGTWVGGFFGVIAMCLFQVNRRDDWKDQLAGSLRKSR